MKHTPPLVAIQRAMILFTFCCPILVPSISHTFRAPQVGGHVNLYLPQNELIQTQRQLLYIPLLEPVVETEWVKNKVSPPLKKFPRWRSRIIKDLRSQKSGKVWTVYSDEPIPLLEASLKDCLLPQRMKALWPSWVIRALNETPDFRIQTNAVQVQFQNPIPVFPKLLTGCLYFGPEGRETGAFAMDSATRLKRNPRSLRPPISLTSLTFLQNEESADIVGGSPKDADGELLLAPFPDVVLLLQTQKVVTRDPLTLRQSAGGLDSFIGAINPNAMLSLYWSGRGAAYSGILPPGVGPPRPLPKPTTGELMSLRLDSLPSDAPSVAISRWPQDELTKGIFERMGVILRTQGVRADSVQSFSQPSDMQIVRWRPPVDDPALALLVLAGQYPEYLLTDDLGDRLRNDRRLLSEREAERLAAAVQWEQRWLSDYFVIPLMTAERWYVYKPNLENVIIEADGLPRLEDAYWSQEP